MGGGRARHAASLMTGQELIKAIGSLQYTAIPITIDAAGKWQVGADAPATAIDGLGALQRLGVDGAINALHGPYGSDGRLAGLLDLIGVPYWGSGCAASALAMDKVRCKAVVAAQGIRVAGHLALDAATWAMDAVTVERAVRQDIGFPCAIKPASQGLTQGIALPQSAEEFAPALERMLFVESYVMVEKFVRGTEVCCGVLDTDPKGHIRSLPIVEIRAGKRPGEVECITPAPLAPDLTDRIMDMAAHAHEIVGCKGWSQSDFIIDEQGPVWLKLETVPGLTETSSYTRAAAAIGIPHVELVRMFIEYMLQGRDNQTGIKA